MSKGKLYGVSVGPGDPDLMTRRAYQLLQQAACWTYPVRNSKSDSYALSIATAAGLTPPDDHKALVFPMTHDADRLKKHWVLAANTVIEMLTSGTDVMFLVEGDASTYSTFGHLARHVSAIDNSIHIETIAGVPSFNAAAARLDIPLTEVDDTMAVLPAAYGIPTIERLLREFDTLVLLKAKPLLDDIIDLLGKHNLLQHSTFIEKAGSKEERIFRDVASLKGQKVNYLSLMLVKNPGRVKGELIRGCRSKSKEKVSAT